jgi:hypothetical protein
MFISRDVKYVHLRRDTRAESHALAEIAPLGGKT